MDVDARVQLFDLRNQYVFQTTPGIDSYNMPLYTVQTQPGAQAIGPFPVYQGFYDPVFINGIQVPFYTSKNDFWNLWPNYVQQTIQGATGNGIAGSSYIINLSSIPAIPGHVDITGIIANYNGTGSLQDPIITSNLLTNIPTTSVYPGVYITSVDSNGAPFIISDSGQFLQGSQQYGLLMLPGAAPTGNTALPGGYSITSNTVNYQTGVINFTLPILTTIPTGTNINVQTFFYEQGIPRALLFYNNTMTIRPPPNISYRVELNAYLSPAAFLNSSLAIPFGYMAEYIARGAARKILSDTGDWEQFNLYESLFLEQERLVWKRSQRQFTATRTATIFSQTQGQTNYNNLGAGTN